MTFFKCQNFSEQVDKIVVFLHDFQKKLEIKYLRDFFFRSQKLLTFIASTSFSRIHRELCINTLSWVSFFSSFEPRLGGVCGIRKDRRTGSLVFFVGVDAEVQFLIICFGCLFCCFFFETFVNLLNKFVIFRSFPDYASLAFFDGLCPQ